MSGRRILVTGADGFIGSHVVEALALSGHDVRAFVFYNSFGSRGWLDHVDAHLCGNLEFVAGDIRDPHCVRSALEGCDIVLHLAALVAIPYSYLAPLSYVETNITGTLNVLQAARDLGLSRIVQTSTSEVYGTAQFVPITEQHPLRGQSPYAATKIGADQMALSYHRSFGTPVIVLRPFNAYGPRQSQRAVIPAIISQLLAGDGHLELGSVHPTRDFSFVRDLARAFVMAAESDAGMGEVINIGSNFEISISDTAQLIADILGRPLEIETDQIRVRPAASEVDRLWADNCKALDILGWAPEFAGRAGFERGIAATIDWFSDPANRNINQFDGYEL